MYLPDIVSHASLNRGAAFEQRHDRVSQVLLTHLRMESTIYRSFRRAIARVGGVLFVLAIYLLLAEALARSVNVIFPLERLAPFETVMPTRC